MENATKPAQLFLAATASFPGYWGSSKESPHHAIASACLEGANRGGVFVVYDAYEGCRFDGFGGLTYLIDHGEPKIDGIYDAAGNLLGETMEEAAKDAKAGYFQPEHNALDWENFRRLRDHKPKA